MKAAEQSEFADMIDRVQWDDREHLMSKNAQYGNSALDPLHIFATGSPVEQLRIQIDHKLSRIARGVGDDEDSIGDLRRYLILLEAAQRLERGE